MSVGEAMKRGNLLKKTGRVLSVGLGILLVGCGGGERSDDGVELRLVLDFLPNPIHAGIYYAQDQGDFRERGVDLTITAPTSTTDTLRLVASGRADVGLVPLMDFFQARENGQDFLLVMALVDRPLAAVMVRESTGITRPRELEGRLVGLTGVPSDAMTLEAMVRQDGGDPARVRTVTIGFNAAQSLVAGTVDAAFGFWSYEGVLAGRSIALRYLRPEAHGIPNYPEIVAFVRRDYAERHPEAVRAFRETAAAGYAAALAVSPAEALRGLGRALDGESVEEMEPFWKVLQPVVPRGEGFDGTLRAEELQRYLDWVVEQGFLSEGPQVKALIFDRKPTGV